jgi:hypothetical protein
MAPFLKFELLGVMQYFACTNVSRLQSLLPLTPNTYYFRFRSSSSLVM